MKPNKKINTHKLTGIAMLSAVAFVLQFLEFSIPIVPSFLKFDFSDLPELIGAFAYGPVAGIMIAFFKNLIHLPFSSSMYIGELSNFILGATFAGVAGLVYKKHKNKKGAVAASISGAAAMALICVPINNFIIYPLYYSDLNFSEEAILGMYQLILPSVKSIFEALLIFNLPFTLIKGLLCALIDFPIYKPLSKVLKFKKSKRKQNV